MNSAGVFGASLWSGYALPACHPENGTRRQPAELPLIQSGNLSRRSRPALADGGGQGAQPWEKVAGVALAGVRWPHATMHATS